MPVIWECTSSVLTAYLLCAWELRNESRKHVFIDYLTRDFSIKFSSRQLAEASPYFEAFKAKDQEVLFCYDEYDELTMLQLREWDRKVMRSVETEMVQGSEESKETETSKLNLTYWIWLAACSIVTQDCLRYYLDIS